MNDLEPKEALVVFIRRSETAPTRYMAGIRKTQTNFHPELNDLRLTGPQVSVSELGEFDDLGQAIEKACDKLRGLIAKHATA
jgi:hypothetical protein